MSLRQSAAVSIDISIQPYGQNVTTHTVTLWTLASFNIHPGHMGEAQGSGSDAAESGAKLALC